MTIAEWRYSERLRSTRMNQIIRAINGRGVAGVFNVQAYGAVGDGSTDDTAAVRSAKAAAVAAGKGTLYFPDGDYLCNDYRTILGSRWIFDCQNSDIHWLGQSHLARIFSTVHACYLFNLHLDADLTLIDFEDRVPHYQTAYTIATGGAQLGASSVTLDTPGETSNFTVGQWVFVRTGQTIQSDGLTQPISELNRVYGVSGADIDLEWPLARSYVLEREDLTGSYGGSENVPSCPTGGGDPLPFAIAPLPDAMVNERMSWRNLSLEVTGAGDTAIFSGGQVVDWVVDGCRLSYPSVAFNPGLARRMWITSNSFYSNRYDAAGAFWANFAQSMGDAFVTNNWVSGRSAHMCHVHEACYNVKVHNNTIYSPDEDASNFAVSVRGRGDAISILGNSFVGGGQIRMDGPGDASGIPGIQGGVVVDNIMRGSHVGFAVGEGTVFHGNQLVRTGSQNGLGRGAVQTPTVVTGWLSDSRQSIELGFLQPDYYVIDVRVVVTEAFNSSGTDLVKVGWAGAPNGYSGDIDVSTTGIKIGSEAFYNVLTNESTRGAILATYVNGGTEPSTGKALVMVSYIQVESFGAAA